MNAILRDEQVPISIEAEMRRSFLDYSMSVIISRALPDVRDGLKPVHRRILITLNDLNLSHTRPYRKCAKIAGDVSGNYHPHGEGVVYPSLVRLAQTFSMRYPLVDGQGNFGSVDGDEPAAMRYTEARMTRIAEEMLRDLDKETVDFTPNYDESREEPTVLPSVIPNLLMNGSTGIAVGMATNIPPHNLTELAGAFLYLLDNPEASVIDLMKFIPGPDFPTAAFIYGRKGIREAYESGRGLIQLRARVNIEKDARTGREAIVITQLPYQVNKARLVEKIAELAKDRRIDGVVDLRDESDRSGMRVVIDLRRDEMASVLVRQLFKHTQMQVSFGIIMLALVDKQPRVLSLRQMMDYFLAHRQEVVIRRTRYDLKKARDRAHVLEGLKIALDNLDRIIALIRGAESPPAARQDLVAEFEMTERQAQAILELRLQRLTALEREDILQEREAILVKISELEGILVDPEKVRQIIKDEFVEVRDQYGDERRTEIIEETEEVDFEDLIVEEDMVVTVSHSGYIKRNASSLYRSQHRGGKGVTGMTTRDEDFVKSLFVASTHDYILFFTSLGKIHWLKVHGIPQAGRAAKGKAIVNLLQLARDEHVRAYLNVRNFAADAYVVLVTRRGIIKKTELKSFSHPRVGGIIALAMDDDDDLIAARPTDGSRSILLSTRKGKSIHFKEDVIRAMGRAARGVTGIRLGKDDAVVSMEVLGPNTTLLTVTERGYGKRTASNDYRQQGRGGSGIIDIKTTPRNGDVVGVSQVLDDDDVMLVTAEGSIIRMPVKTISKVGRNTQGVRLIDVAAGDKVVSIARVED